MTLHAPLKVWLVGIAVAAIVIGIVLASPLFYDNMVDEALPAALDELRPGLTMEEFAAMDERPRDAIVAEMPDELKQMIMDTAAESQTMVSDADMPGNVLILRTGQFEGLAGHSAQGDAKVLQAGGQTYLRFENFKVTNGPDLRVYLTLGGDVKQGVHLEKLKGNVGSQNYSLDGIDAGMYDTVVIYCQPFGAYFGQAPLS